MREAEEWAADYRKVVRRKVGEVEVYSGWYGIHEERRDRKSVISKDANKERVGGRRRAVVDVWRRAWRRRQSVSEQEKV